MIETIILILVIGVVLFELVEHMVFLCFGLSWGGRENLFVGRLACWVRWVRSNGDRIIKEKFLLTGNYGRLSV